MAYILKLNNEEVAKEQYWNPRIFSKLTGTSYPKEVSKDYIWEQDSYWLGWIADPVPEPYVPTMEELSEQVRSALQEIIDDKARALGFSNGNALMLYAGFTNGFQTLAQTFATWEASVWFEAEAYKQEVIAGTKPMLTPEEALALMPTYPL